MARKLNKAEMMEYLKGSGVDIVHYKELLDRLKSNRQKVPLEVLKTRYAKAYSQLCAEIRDITEVIAKTTCTGLIFRYDEFDEAVAEINRRISESGIMYEISCTVFQRQDMDRFLELICNLDELISVAYADVLSNRINL